MVESLQTLKKRYCAKVPGFAKQKFQNVTRKLSKVFGKGAVKKTEMKMKKDIKHIERDALRSCTSNNVETFLEGGIGPIDKDFRAIVHQLQPPSKKDSEKILKGHISATKFVKQDPFIQKLAAKRFHTSNAKVRKALNKKLQCLQTRKSVTGCQLEYIKDLV